MNICLVQPFCIPGGSSHPPLLNKQQILATSLVKLGHQVHIITLGDPAHFQQNTGVFVHEIPGPLRTNSFSTRFPDLDEPLTYSQAVYEALRQLALKTSLDIVEVPLWMATGLVTLIYYSGPVVVNLSTWPEFFKWRTRQPASRTAQLAGLERECLKRATAIIADSSAILSEVRQCYDFGQITQPTWVVPSGQNHTGHKLNRANDELSHEAINFYARICHAYQSRPHPQAKRVYQVGDAVDFADAVGNIMRRNAKLLSKVGGESIILAKYAHQAVAHEVTTFHSTQVRADDGLIFHYWGYSELEPFLRQHRGPKAIHYHNITPPEYFPPQSRQYEMCRRGYQQLARMADEFDLIIGDSNFNIAELARFLTRPKPTLWIPPVTDVQTVQLAPFDEALYQQVKASAQVNFLFVGRVVRNKRHDQIIRLFDYYYREINNHSRLYLVGNSEHTSEYFQELETLRQRSACKDRVIFTGKVSDQAVQAYYRAADVFISASEHEGFGIPLLEAMAHNVPVVALATSAVPETMGGAGILIHRWDIPGVAELINLLLKDELNRTRLLAKQRQNLERFTTKEVQRRLNEAVKFLRTGEHSSFIQASMLNKDESITVQ